MTDTTSNSFMDGIFVDDAIYEAPQPPKKEFLPWHLPRKQFVRKMQWCRQLIHLVEKRKPEQGPIKYFGLPGVDLLDLKYIYTEVCEKKQIPLCFLGFNQNAHPKSANGVQLNISLDEIRRKRLVEDASDVLGDNYCQLALPNSIAWRKTQQIGPYDIINLDLCDGFAKGAPNQFDNDHYNALNRLLALQARYNQPWLLLLTTRVGNGHVHKDVLEKFKSAYKMNLESSDAFTTASKESFSIEKKEQIEAALEGLKGQTDIFLTGLYKWILGMVLSQRPHTIATLQNVIGYRVTDSDHEDLISIAFRMTPSFDCVPDHQGISGVSADIPKEYDLAATHLPKIAGRVDADTLLKEKDKLMESMISEMKGLLVDANYDGDAYSKWAIEESSKFSTA